MGTLCSLKVSSGFPLFGDIPSPSQVLPSPNHEWLGRYLSGIPADPRKELRRCSPSTNSVPWIARLPGLQADGCGNEGRLDSSAAFLTFGTQDSIHCGQGMVAW